MSLAENIKRCRLTAKLTQAELAKKIGVTRATVTQWETGWSQPRIGTLQKLAEAFEMPMSDLVSDKKIPFPNAIRPTAQKTAPVPLYGRVHAGKPCDPITYEDSETVKIPEFLIKADPETYALIAEGDCMNNIYPEGCTIAVSPNRPPINGSVAVVSIDGRDAVMRRLYRTHHTLILAPDSTNPIHEDIVITDDSDHTVEFLGRVVWFQARREME